MAEYIEREALLKELATHFNKVDGRTLYHPSMSLAMHDVRNAPAADVEPVKHGRWIEQEAPNMDTYCDCSACGESFVFIDGSPKDNLYTYCPNCGAKMDLEEV